MPETTSDLAAIVHRGRPKPWRNRVILAVVILAAIGTFLYFRAKNSAEEAKPVYTTEALERGDLSINITATGNLQPTNKVSVSSELSGISEQVFVDTNDAVKKGQQLAKLDTRKLNQQTAKTRATLAAAKARVTQASATVRESSANLARLQELHQISGGRTPSKAELDTAVAATERAKADEENVIAAVAGAEADLAAIESDLAKAVIRSPVDGVVLIRSLEPGQTVAASFSAPELFVIAEDLKKMELLVSVAEADIGQLKDGQTASFSVDAWPGRTYNASVKKVFFGSTVLDNVVTYMTELVVNNDDLSLRPGMTATADISVASTKNVLLVPAAALRFKPADPDDKSAGPEQKKTFMQSITFQFPRRRMGQRPPGGRGEGKKGPPDQGEVWILESGEPKSIPVKIGLSDGRKTEIITDQLKENDEIIIRQVIEESPKK